MHQLICATGLSIFLLFVSIRCEDRYCVDRDTKPVLVDPNDRNPQRVMTYVEKEVGYKKNLQCKWILKPKSYNEPRQMYIQVTVVDFDVNDENQCNDRSNADLDVLSLQFKLNDSAFRTETWCSDKSVKIKRRIVNLWDSSYNLTVEFQSDNNQVRSDAKGVQINVQVLAKDYCLENMLFFDGSCYLITLELLTPEEAFRQSSNYLGNVFTVPAGQEISNYLRRLYQANLRRKSEVPYESPLNLTSKKLWTGYFIDSANNSSNMTKELDVKFLDTLNGCSVTERQMVVTFESMSSAQCALAVQWFGSDGTAKFTCEPVSSRLPALIGFKQIPETKANNNLRLFRTCTNALWFNKEIKPFSDAYFKCNLGCWLSISGAILAVLILILIWACFIYCACCRRRDSPWQDFVVPLGEKQEEEQPLQA